MPANTSSKPSLQASINIKWTSKLKYPVAFQHSKHSRHAKAKRSNSGHFCNLVKIITLSISSGQKETDSMSHRTDGMLLSWQLLHVTALAWFWAMTTIMFFCCSVQFLSLTRKSLQLEQPKPISFQHFLYYSSQRAWDVFFKRCYFKARTRVPVGTRRKRRR